MALARTRVAVPLEKFPDRQPNAVQASVAKVAAQVNQQPRPGQVTIKDQLFVTGSTILVVHGLGRIAVGYNPVNIRPHPTTGATAAQGFQRDLSADTEQVIGLGVWQPCMADIEVW